MPERYPSGDGRPDRPELITLERLTDSGLTADDVRDHCPGAVEYTGLDGTRCWLCQDLGPLYGDEGGHL
jgi:hypothetical protein